jgi:hypothetical protein
MSNCPLCNIEPAPNPSGGKRPSGLVHRAWRSIQWLFPATILVLIPKCPLCVAAYVALFTGVAISVSTAQWIKILMVVFCLGSLAYLAVRHWRERANAHGGAASS